METILSKPDRIPPAVDIEELLTTLLDLDVEVKTISKVAYSNQDICVLGLFEGRESPRRSGYRRPLFRQFHRCIPYPHGC